MEDEESSQHYIHLDAAPRRMSRRANSTINSTVTEQRVMTKSEEADAQLIEKHARDLSVEPEVL